MSKNWYQKRLSGQSHPGGLPPTAAPSPPPQQQSAPTPATQRPPQSSLQDNHCPECGSGNYMRSPQHPNSAMRCYDCGYPVQQSGSGIGSVGTPRTDGTVHRATQVEGGGFNPGQIVGRVD